ncbi:peptidoglycan D,D-transpeptidase FtsI family protein [Arenimonas sp.]|uniref:peptidoglycan D,D-transpeptidase FtsI family protein n=1 Tax=Arenimonas sp. TaxID=1872635 RepID=UPI0039E5B34C
MKTRARPYDLKVRLTALAGVLGLCGVVLVGRAAQMQLLNKDFYQHQGEARFLREIPIPTSRGMIMDRNGEPLAVSTPVESVWANPQELLQHPERLPELAKALGIPQDVLTQRVAQRSDKEFVYLRRHINPDDAQAVVARGIPGVYAQREFRRFYPHGEVMAHALGFTNIDDRGQEGLELAFDGWLTGKPGAQKIIRDRRGRIVENVDLVRAAEPGKDLTLSIDRRIQYLAYRELKSALLANQASSGSVVVLDIPTGEILAMVNQPAYNPNAREAAIPGTHRNRALTDVVEPGSVIKALTVAAALESGVDSNVVVPTTPLVVSGHPIRDVHDYGPVTLERLLQKSSNIGASRLALNMSNEHFYDVLHRFGFGQNTGSGFPGESAGVLAPPRSWGQLEKATISYGYGLSVTPLQIAQAYAALGNDGRLMPPTFVKGGGSSGRQVLDPRIAREVLGMLESVTKPGGSATRAAVTGYHVAGKTGTSRKFTRGGYEKKYISLFAGVVPMDHPKFAMVVVIHNPSGRDYYGGLVSAPVFHNVMDGALRLMDVPPDHVEQWYASEPVANAPQAATTPATAPMEAQDAAATPTGVAQ